ncbi:hypothetical protein LTR62_004939 [Meristemomyces frigidus]|uniref:Thaumatin-like protein n=1 Tax=Meristemomyces frigidus TaxID=1508187 RepID=A0AAN7YJM2_9PEZI|nr:hypothetical protein LTR62_004939 [Meristemomyces frigidus]
MAPPTTTLHLLALLSTSSLALHHMRDPSHRSLPRQNSNSNTIPIVVTNLCAETIFPAIFTQGGTGPSQTGWLAQSGSNTTLQVSPDWQGRVWARSNCTFDSSGVGTWGSACSTGDCGGLLACKGPGAAPATLAEFTFAGSGGQAFYDISMVDGYNYPLAITMNPNGNSALSKIDPSTTNPSCVASVGDFYSGGTYNPYANSQTFLGTTSSSPLPFDTQMTASSVSQWCPWDLQVSPPTSPGDGVYPYPDTGITRPAFNPCNSACVKYGQANYCCTGKYNSPQKCSPSYYSSAAKKACPDAYSYAYDDQTSTFVIPSGAGFGVVFCPGGRSTNIIGSKGAGSIVHS